MAECEPRPFTTTLKPFDISGFSKEKIEEAVLGEILRQVAADRAAKKISCVVDTCPQKSDNCTVIVSADTYKEIADKLTIHAYTDDDGHTSYNVGLTEKGAAGIEVASLCWCVRRHREKKWL